MFKFVCAYLGLSVCIFTQAMWLIMLPERSYFSWHYPFFAPLRWDSNPSRLTYSPPSPLHLSANFPDRSPVLIIYTPGRGKASHGAIYLPPGTKHNNLLMPKSLRYDQMMRVTCSNKGFDEDGVALTGKIVPLIALRSIATIGRIKLEAWTIYHVLVEHLGRCISD